MVNCVLFAKRSRKTRPKSDLWIEPCSFRGVVRKEADLSEAGECIGQEQVETACKYNSSEKLCHAGARKALRGYRIKGMEDKVRRLEHIYMLIGTFPYRKRG